MAYGTTKVKLSVEKLTGRLEEVLKDLEAEYEGEAAAYSEKVAKWAAKCALRAAEISKLKAEDLRRGDKPFSMPYPPDPPRQDGYVIEDLKRQIRTLKMVSDTEMIITLGDDLVRYI